MAVDPMSIAAAATGLEPGNMTLAGPEWKVGGVPADTDPAAAGSFKTMLTGQIAELGDMQAKAAQASQALAAGTADDVSAVVMAVDRARLGMQLAAQIRTKGVEAYQEIFRTQV